MLVNINSFEIYRKVETCLRETLLSDRFKVFPAVRCRVPISIDEEFGTLSFNLLVTNHAKSYVKHTGECTPAVPGYCGNNVTQYHHLHNYKLISTSVMAAGRSFTKIENIRPKIDP